MKKLLFSALLVSLFHFSAQGAMTEVDSTFELLPEKITAAKKSVFPALVFIRSVNDMQDQGLSAKVNSSGSGVILNNEGLVLTNWHVINKADHIRCQTTDGDAFEAEVVGSDKDIDIALIKLKTDRKDFPVAELVASDKMTYGDFVIAMGAPWGMSRSVSLGIISCPQRYLEQNQYTLYLQTDASISPGNSGGPLVNTDGKVIGINTLGSSQGGGDIGFAVPTSTILEVIDDLKNHKAVQWSWTGIDLQAINDFSKNIFFEKGQGGVIVANIEPKSPAEKAGLKARDRILTIAGKKCDALSEESIPNIKRYLSLLKADQPIELVIERDKQNITLQITPIARGASEGASETYDRWGVTFAEINRFETPNLFHHKDSGIYIKSFTERSNAQNCRFIPGDILISIDNKAVNSLPEAKEIYDATLKNIDNKTKAVLKVLRNGRQMDIVLDYTTDLNNDDDDDFDY